ncbi:MAG: hypothetical protein K1X57_19000 [Gemmataceae bacterium]|nr:hypothetical protein [Gemmataceae bacterium]
MRPPNDDEPDPNDSFYPPAIPTLVHCTHCGEEYESYLMEWRVSRNASGVARGFWCCGTPNCDGIGFGCDIWPIDPDYEDERGVFHTSDDDEDFEDIDLPVDDGDEPPTPGDEQIPF